VGIIQSKNKTKEKAVEDRGGGEKEEQWEMGKITGIVTGSIPFLCS